MVISYEEFCDLLNKYFQNGDDLYLSLLEKVIDTPHRYIGIFRLSTFKTKLMQNITQSREIRFGEFLERLTTEYIVRLGYKTFDKDLGVDLDGAKLNVDQYFTDGESLYLVEMKVRDDHDSTKKRGQYLNFHKKINLVRRIRPGVSIQAIMWFVDDALAKNRRFYQGEMAKETIPDTVFHLFYGSEFFDTLNCGKVAWSEFIEILTQYRVSHAYNDDIELPDFGSSKQFYEALIKLPPKYWNKLMSEKDKYVSLRRLLFSSGDNLELAKRHRRGR